MTLTSKHSVTVNIPFADAVTAYAQANKLSWSAALVTLAAQALGYEGEPVGKHGSGERFQAGKRCTCGDAWVRPEKGVNCARCGKSLFGEREE